MKEESKSAIIGGAITGFAIILYGGILSKIHCSNKAETEAANNFRRELVAFNTVATEKSKRSHARNALQEYINMGWASRFAYRKASRAMSEFLQGDETE